MPRLVWSAAALDDLVRLHSFLHPKNADAARRAIQAIRHGVRELARHPEIGRSVEDLPTEFREWVIKFGHGAYVALYHLAPGQVVLLAVRHGRETSE